MARTIDEILHFRSDISPFLAHLTREREEISAKNALHSILEQRSLVVGSESISAAQYAIKYKRRKKLEVEELREYFGAVSFTETPISEIHCLLEIEGRKVDLAPYGLVFLKSRLRDRGVSPVMYLNNVDGRMNDAVRAMLYLKKVNEEAAAKILPLISFFGQHITGPDRSNSSSEMDFSWEREWRYPASEGPFEFDEDDIFVGICPHEEIDEFESELDDVGFIDPMRPMEWYAPKLIEARKRHDLKYSVV